MESEEILKLPEETTDAALLLLIKIETFIAGFCLMESTTIPLTRNWQWKKVIENKNIRLYKDFF